MRSYSSSSISHGLRCAVSHLPSQATQQEHQPIPQHSPHQPPVLAMIGVDEHLWGCADVLPDSPEGTPVESTVRSESAYRPCVI